MPPDTGYAIAEVERILGQAVANDQEVTVSITSGKVPGEPVAGEYEGMPCQWDVWNLDGSFVINIVVGPMKPEAIKKMAEEWDKQYQSKSPA